MRRSRLAGGLGAAAILAGSTVLAAPVFADATDQQSVTLKCTMPDFGSKADFDYAVTVDFTSSGPTDLQATVSDMPGVVPPAISMKNQPAKATLGVEVDGVAVDLSVTGTTDVNPTGDFKTKDPLAIPGPLVGTPAALAATSVVEIKTFAFDVAGVAGSCALPGVTPPGGGGDGGNGGGGGGGTDTDDDKDTDKDTDKDKDSDKDDDSSTGRKAVPAKGQAKFACKLEPLKSPFDYNPQVTLEGVRATEDDPTVKLRLQFSDIAKDDGKGLAPVAMDGDMKITASALVDGQTVDFEGSSKVQVAASQPVPVPVLESELDVEGETLTAEITAFKFDFGELPGYPGMEWFSDCTGGGVLSDMTVGIGELSAIDDDDDDDTTATPVSDTAATLPRTGGADSMPVVALWALALGVMGAALLVLLPRQRRDAH